MIPENDLKISRGNVVKRQKDRLKAARNYLCKSFGTSTTVKKDINHQSRVKEEQKKQLIIFTGYDTPY
jgi:hypothetical protein